MWQNRKLHYSDHTQWNRHKLLPHIETTWCILNAMHNQIPFVWFFCLNPPPSQLMLYKLREWGTQLHSIIRRQKYVPGIWGSHCHAVKLVSSLCSFPSHINRSLLCVCLSVGALWLNRLMCGPIWLRVEGLILKRPIGPDQVGTWMLG